MPVQINCASPGLAVSHPRSTHTCSYVVAFLACVTTLSLSGCESDTPSAPSATAVDRAGADGDEPHDTPKRDAGRNDGGAKKTDASGVAHHANDSEHDAVDAHVGDDLPDSSDGGAHAGNESPHDHCVDGELAAAGDAQLDGTPDQWKASDGAIDLVLPKSVLAWMSERVWTQSHDAWHNVRRCSGGGFGGFGGSSAVCSHKELIPAHQECADAEDGYQFLVMHRHMMRALRQAFPQHTELFAGFASFPLEAKDVPSEWQSRWGTGWAQSVKDTAKTLEAIESKLTQFPTEGDLGKFIQCGAMSNGASSIHGALHFKWVVNSSPHSLGKQTVNIENYMFWKLHGWIDTIWERYRTAKGLSADEPKLREALTSQCREMHTLGQVVAPTSSTPNDDPLPVEHGVFHESVRPILEKVCSGCHSESSPEAGLPLGGHVSSADIVKQLVNVGAMHGGQLKRVLPGDPDRSWLYLKVSGTAMAAGCQGAGCNTQVMPPAGQVSLTKAELATIRQWIADGAPAPTK
ncbi:MAG: hypothetical protein RLZZ450_4403 [Pseudomonadota bacterium]|jgi:hypothetical protein